MSALYPVPETLNLGTLTTTFVRNEADDWSEYSLHLAPRGRADIGERVADLTVYRDGHALALKSAALRTATGRAAWERLYTEITGIKGAYGHVMASSRTHA